MDPSVMIELNLLIPKKDSLILEIFLKNCINLSEVRLTYSITK